MISSRFVDERGISLPRIRREDMSVTRSDPLERLFDRPDLLDRPGSLSICALSLGSFIPLKIFLA